VWAMWWVRSVSARRRDGIEGESAHKWRDDDAAASCLTAERQARPGAVAWKVGRPLSRGTARKGRPRCDCVNAPGPFEVCIASLTAPTRCPTFDQPTSATRASAASPMPYAPRRQELVGSGVNVDRLERADLVAARVDDPPLLATQRPPISTRNPFAGMCRRPGARLRARRIPGRRKGRSRRRAGSATPRSDAGRTRR
jgi:hypothetical protein